MNKPTDTKILSKTLKSMILYHLPKGFHCKISKTGLTVNIWVDVNKVGGWDKANRLVYSLAEQLKLEEISSGTDLITNVRGWDFINTTVEKQMAAEAKDILKTMRSFFKKYGNSYCDSNKCYKVIDQMHTLVADNEC